MWVKDQPDGSQRGDRGWKWRKKEDWVGTAWVASCLWELNSGKKMELCWWELFTLLAHSSLIFCLILILSWLAGGSPFCFHPQWNPRHSSQQRCPPRWGHFSKVGLDNILSLVLVSCQCHIVSSLPGPFLIRRCWVSPFWTFSLVSSPPPLSHWSTTMTVSRMLWQLSFPACDCWNIFYNFPKMREEILYNLPIWKMREEIFL